MMRRLPIFTEKVYKFLRIIKSLRQSISSIIRYGAAAPLNAAFHVVGFVVRSLQLET